MEHKTTAKLRQSTIVAEAKVHDDTQLHRIKGGSRVPPPPPPLHYKRRVMRLQ